MKRRHFALSLPVATALATLPHWPAQAQAGKSAVVLGMTLEPTGLDPTAGAASAIAEVVHYNIFETLTKINSDGSISPLLAERWDISPDLRTITFHLRRGVRFSNGVPLTAEAVKFSFERAASEQSTNKDKANFVAMDSIHVEDEHTVVIVNKEPNPDLLFYLGQSSAIIVEPGSADGNNSQPVGTGPYQLERWAKGSSISLKAWPGYRDAGAVVIQRATFRFITDPAAQIAAVLSGDVDAFVRVSPRGLGQFERNPRLQTIKSGSRAKTVLSINNKKKPLDDVRVRRAISMAIDRNAVIQGAGDGLGVPIGSHYPPSAPGYVDTTGVNPYDPERARALLAEAGVQTPLELSLVLPPPPYARQGGEVIVAQLAQIGITAKVQTVEWAQWLANVYGGPHNYDLTIVSHVEPFDLASFAKPDFYWGYSNPEFDALLQAMRNNPDEAGRLAQLAEIQQLLAEDAVLAWLYQPLWLSVAHKDLRGLWQDMPIFVNDLAALHWAR